MSEDFLSNFLAKLGAGSKDTVYLSVTPGTGLELCLLDQQTRTVKAYAVRPLTYNETSRDIGDYETFKTAVGELFEELKINPKCNVVVNLPLVSLGTMSFPLLLADDAIATGITSEVEQTYIFRRMEPVVAWQDVNSASNAGSDTRKILYSAIQKATIDNISEALTSLGATLAGVEVSLASYLRALDFAGYTTAQMQENVTWNLMIISSTGYSLTSLVGKNVIDYYEEPLAIKTFEGDDIYNAIVASAQITLMSYPANYLYIISETDQVSAELLSTKIQGAGNIDFLENNSFKKQEVLPVSLDILPDNVLKISLQAVGCAATNISNYPLKFNFLGNKISAPGEEPVSLTFGDKSFEITPTAATNMAVLIAVIVAVPLLLLAYVFLPKVETEQQQKLDDVNVKIQEIDAQLKTMEGEKSKVTAFELKKEVEGVISSNRAKLMNYSALGQSIPETVWITYFMTQDNGLVDIKGESTNVEDIYLFFKNMKDSLINTKLRLQKLDMKAASVDDIISSSEPSSYEFEITNMDQSQLAALLGIVAGQNGAAPAGQNAQNNNNNQSGGNGLLGNTPLNIGK